jgi:serine/threonine protein kinase
LEAIDTCSDQKRVVIKQMSFRVMRENNMFEAVEREVNCLSFLYQTGIEEKAYFVEVYESFILEQNRDKYFCIVCERCIQTLAQYIKASQQFNVIERLEFLCEVSAGVHYLHSQGVIHRDLKPENILLKKRNGRLAAVIADFGTLKEINTMMTCGRGTVLYVDPTLIDKESYSHEWDVYSLGLIIL